MSFTKTYSVANDTLNGEVNTALLRDEIDADLIILTALGDSPITNDDDLVIEFKETPPAPELTQLDALVAAHTGEFLDQPQLLTLADIGVTSFNTRQGDVVPQTGDYTAAQVGADPAGTAAAAVAAHEAASDPHSQYTTPAEAAAAAPVQSVNGATGTVVLNAGDVGADPAGTAASAVAAHEGAADPHGQYQQESEKGVAGGYASLDGTGKVPASQLPADGDLNFQGFWDADTNTPALASGVGTEGDYWFVQTAGTTNLDGETGWQVGDKAIFHSGAWVRLATGGGGGSTFPILIAEAEDDTFRSTTNEGWTQVQRLSFTAPATGRYKIEWMYLWSHNATNTDFQARVQLDDTTDLYGDEDHVEEPQDSGGGGAGGTNQRFPTSFWRYVDIDAGARFVDIDISTNDDDDASSVYLTGIAVWRVS